MKKGVMLFGNRPEKPFAASGPDEINVLAITSYHAGVISEDEERRLVSAYLDETETGRVVDAVALYVMGSGSGERLYFAKDQAGEKKALILRALKKPEEVEDHARVGLWRFPRELEDVIAEILPEGTQ